MSSTAVLMWGLIFGAIGFGFVLYGKKQRAVVPLLTGLTLCLLPYFITNVYTLVGIGIALIAIPYFVKV